METTEARMPARKRRVKLMGNQFELTVVSDDVHWADDRIDEAVL